MPKVKVSQEISGKKKEVYTAVKNYLKGRSVLAKLGAEIDWDDKACTANIEASNFEGGISISDHDGDSMVTISVDLPLLLTPFKGKVEEELKKHLGRVKAEFA